MVSKLEFQVEGESFRGTESAECGSTQQRCQVDDSAECGSTQQRCQVDDSVECGSTQQRCQVDDSVGTLVWVRRRNGHWWPGRVLAVHEVPQSILLFPKSGKPVRLLGKDDANVDWYNIEKSRRIKAFRCGEFDKIIERAQSCASNLKKREKYARREEAILHALSLEKLQAEERQIFGGAGGAWACTGSSKLPSHEVAKHDNISSMCYGDHVNTTPHPTPKAPLASSSNGVLAFSRTNNLEGDEDVLEAIPRMRDLQDFGLHITSCKDRKNVCKSVSVSEAPLSEDQSKVESCVTRISTVVSSAPSISNVSAAAMAQKRKKQPAGSSADEGHYRKRERRKPLTHFLTQSSNNVAVHDGKFINKMSVYDGNFVNIQTRMRLKDATAATSSQENELRPCSELKHFQPISPFGYEFERETHEIWAASEKISSSFLSPCLDGGRWPLLLRAPPDFGLLLGSTYADLTFGRTPTSLFSGMAYAGSITNENTSGFRDCLRQEGLNLSSGLDHRRGNSARGEGNELQDSDSEAGNVFLPRVSCVSMWQAKRRRNARRPLRSITEIQSEDVNACRSDQCQGSCGVLPLGCRRQHASSNTRPRNTTFCEEGPITKNIGLESRSLKLCKVSRSPGLRLPDGNCSSTQRLGFCWVDVRLEYHASEVEPIEIVSLFSEVINRAISGYPVSVDILKSRWLCGGTSARVSWNRTKVKTSAGLTATQNASQVSLLCRPTKYCDQRRVSTIHTFKRNVLKGRRSSSKRGSTLQKTRTLSSLATHDQEFPIEHYQQEHQKKAACMTCIPVHVVFNRIREVLYKHSDDTPDGIREAISEK